MSISFTDRELDVMTVLWELGSATVAEVRERLADPLAYTTVLTVLRRLVDKGYVTHREEGGRTHRYLPLIERQQVRESALERLTHRLFHGSPELLLTHLLRRQRLSPGELRTLRELVDGELREEEG